MFPTPQKFVEKFPNHTMMMMMKLVYYYRTSLFILYKVPLCLPFTSLSPLSPRNSRCYLRRSLQHPLHSCTMSSSSSINNGNNVGKGETTEQQNQDNDTAKLQQEVRYQKQILRKEIRQQLKLVSNDTILQQSRQVWDQLHSMLIYQRAKSIGLFLSMPSNEINTEYAVQYAIQQQKHIYIPQVGQNFELADMELIQINTSTPSSSSSVSLSSKPIYDNWPKNKWNIPEPPNDQIIRNAQPGDLDVIIVPGLAFDMYGNRLGQGKGYYDRFIQRMMQLPNNNNENDTTTTITKPILIAVALQCQFINNSDADCDSNSNSENLIRRKIPTNEYDYPMDYIILPNQIIEINKK